MSHAAQVRRLFAVAVVSAVAGLALSAAANHALAWVLFRDLTRSFTVKPPGGIVIHHSATPPLWQSRVNAASIEADHEKRGFIGYCDGKVYHIAYHYVILPDGTIEQGRPEGCLGSHTRYHKYNRWIGICLVGYFDPQWKNKKYSRPTEAQIKSLTQLSYDIMRRNHLGPENIIPHNSIDKTECPGDSFPWNDFINRLNATIEKDQPGPQPGVI